MQTEPLVPPFLVLAVPNPLLPTPKSVTGNKKQEITSTQRWVTTKTRTRTTLRDKSLVPKCVLSTMAPDGLLCLPISTFLDHPLLRLLLRLRSPLPQHLIIALRMAAVAAKHRPSLRSRTVHPVDRVAQDQHSTAAWMIPNLMVQTGLMSCTFSTLISNSTTEAQTVCPFSQIMHPNVHSAVRLNLTTTSLVWRISTPRRTIGVIR